MTRLMDSTRAVEKPVAQVGASLAESILKDHRQVEVSLPDGIRVGRMIETGKEHV